MPPIVPGFITTGAMSVSATGSEWVAVRNLDDRRFVLKVLSVDDVTEAQALAARQLAAYDRIENEHLIRRHGAIALADGTLALILDEASGGSLAQLVGARGQLTAGETVTIVAPLFSALADLHSAGLVHGDLAPGSIMFSADGRPLIGDLGVAGLLGRVPGPIDVIGPGAGTGAGTATATRTRGFLAPEVVGGGAHSPVSDVYALAALGWFCLTGSSPEPAVVRRSLTTLRPDATLRLVDVLTSCLASDPSTRPAAGVAAVEVFDAAPAESVALASVTDPAAEITRRIRAAVVSVPDQESPRTRKKYQNRLALGVVTLLVAVAVGVGAIWFFGPPMTFHLVADRPATQSGLPLATKPATAPVTAELAEPSLPLATLPAVMRRTTPVTAPTPVAATKTPQGPTEVVTAPSSPRTAAASLLQALVDARALAYVARNSALLDLVYAPGAAKADVDKSNIATALQNGGTYLGLSFVIKDATFLDGTAEAAQIRATILTPAYQTGQPDGRKIPHAQEILGPCFFSLSLTPDGWRILALTTP